VNNGLAFAPPAWPLRKLKFTANIRTSNVDKVKNDDELPVHLCNYVDVYYNDRITHDLAFMEGTATPEEINRFALREGQVIITKDSESWDDIAVPALVTEDMANVLCGYHLAIFDPDRTKLDGTFLAWLCRSDTLNDQFKLAANGVTRFGLGQYPMRNAVLALPPLETQKRIAAFLDEKTARIDALIAHKRALLGHLAEKRQALITRAVTKGLSPAAALKDSGIDWLGQIPTHWEVKRLSFVSQVIDCKHRTPEYIDDGIPLVSTTEISPYQIDYQTKRQVSDEELAVMSEGGRRPSIDDIIYSRNASVGSAARVRDERVVCLGQDLCLVRPSNISSSFLEHFLNSTACLVQLGSYLVGATFKRVNVDVIKKYTLPFPPQEEQRAIAAFVDATIASADGVERKVSGSIASLSEYRSALITSAVTGQLEGLQ
jgi:type I restriction enzyme, S subunit